MIQLTPNMTLQAHLTQINELSLGAITSQKFIGFMRYMLQAFSEILRVVPEVVP